MVCNQAVMRCLKQVNLLAGKTSKAWKHARFFFDTIKSPK